MKQKTKKSAARRFKITGSGKVLRRVAFGRHLRRSKSAAQKRRYSSHHLVTGPRARKIKRLLALA
ncbi:50S ribosomal protein L35 [Candidatus Amesbacteria bacterium RIFCSPHIGHO2_01_FULL_48_32]|uniref:Large ribosomal subunit protein bL35 n=1 Tax=Candidatus Amesbacteria bacterium RIFCSPLOWO2_01_FULL_48_25 TaxID=1797259 RepID=A0A1F4ZBW3_9BACT|nr:MAG: 50S ribosomal protein L35 [Candidatus Amesbacteria bacterium RIFCSPHIGHO2_01_FULL_48_32]OGD03783.1 MAG: 50S ribosomal protein L35 [Candidatus Amesbacteria bacterium RIFCSPLOWO2_01_FULL_48_25]HJZ05111.1 50S ribosomal protein L35 [Patescibacteria group bacterium]